MKKKTYLNKNIYYNVEFHFWHDFLETFRFIQSLVFFLVIHPRFVGPFICCQGTYIYVYWIIILLFSACFRSRLLNKCLCVGEEYNSSSKNQKKKTFLVWILISDHRSDTKINNFRVFFFFFFSSSLRQTLNSIHSLGLFFCCCCECPPSSLSYYVCLFTHINVM